MTRLVVVPAMVNAHSHAFQRDLRGAAERPGSPDDDFWSWRTEMFRLAGARSVDHLARLHPDDLAPLARSETAAVLLPGAEFLGAEEIAPGRALADAGAICVLGSDCNPGTSPVASIPAIAGLAVRRYGWSVREALLACTLNAAYVLGMAGETGSLEVGKRGDLILLDGPAAHLPYRFGRNPVCGVLIAGRPAWVRADSAWRVSAPASTGQPGASSHGGGTAWA